MYRPAGSDSDFDSDDDYDGFSFGDSMPKQKRGFWNKDPDELTYVAVRDGNLQELQKLITESGFNLDWMIKGLTLLHHACKFGHLDIVNYLIDNGANPNLQVASITPLMEACDCRTDSQVAYEIVVILLDKGAVINVSNKYGTTPLMFACINGHLKIVKLLIKNASIEAMDNEGWTPIFHAIEKNHIEIVKILLEYGANINLANRKGYTPRQFALFHGFDDILELLPPEKYVYIVPSSFLVYNNLRDCIPRLFLKSDIPEYFQEIYSILTYLKMEKFTEYFALRHITLMEFLVMTDERLKEIGIRFSCHRNKILIGLLGFHLHHWTKNSIGRVTRDETETFYQILVISASHLRDLVTITSAIKYVQQNVERGYFPKIDNTIVKDFKNNVKRFRDSVIMLNRTTKYLRSFSPKKPPLYIDYDEYVAEKRKSQFQKYLKYSIFIGLTIICLKLKKII